VTILQQGNGYQKQPCPAIQLRGQREFIYGSPQYGTTVFLIPDWVVCPATEKRNAERGSAYNQLIASILLSNTIPFPLS